MKKNKIINIYKKLLLKRIDLVDKEILGRKNKFSNDFYLDYILRVLFYGDKWSTMDCPKCNNSTIRKKFYKWKKLGVFDSVYEFLNKEYTKHKTIKYMYIDSVILQNMNCSDLVGFHYKMKTKKTIKLSLICDNDYSIISYIISKPNIHDCKFTEILINKKTINTKEKSYLVGDKGYISKKTKQILKRKGINLITPLRSNQQNFKKINEQNKKYMRNRFKIESTIGHLKRSYKRLQLIYDRNIDNFETFLIMGISCQLIKKIYK